MKKFIIFILGVNLIGCAAKRREFSILVDPAETTTKVFYHEGKEWVSSKARGSAVFVSTPEDHVGFCTGVIVGVGFWLDEKARSTENARFSDITVMQDNGQSIATISSMALQDAVRRRAAARRMGVSLRALDEAFSKLGDWRDQSAQTQTTVQQTETGTISNVYGDSYKYESKRTSIVNDPYRAEMMKRQKDLERQQKEIEQARQLEAIARDEMFALEWINVNMFTGATVLPGETKGGAVCISKKELSKKFLVKVNFAGSSHIFTMQEREPESNKVKR